MAVDPATQALFVFTALDIGKSLFGDFFSGLFGGGGPSSFELRQQRRNAQEAHVYNSIVSVLSQARSLQEFEAALSRRVTNNGASARIGDVLADALVGAGSTRHPLGVDTRDVVLPLLNKLGFGKVDAFIGVATGVVELLISAPGGVARWRDLVLSVRNALETFGRVAAAEVTAEAQVAQGVRSLDQISASLAGLFQAVNLSLPSAARSFVDEADAIGAIRRVLDLSVVPAAAGVVGVADALRSDGKPTLDLVVEQLKGIRGGLHTNGRPEADVVQEIPRELQLLALCLCHHLKQGTITQAGALQSFFEGLWEQIRKGLVSAFEGVTEQVGPVVEANKPSLTGLLNTALDILINFLVNVALPVVDKAAEFPRRAFEPLTAEVQKQLTDFFAKIKEVKPEQADALATELLGLAFKFGTQAQILAASMEIVAPGARIGLSQVAAFMGDMAGFSQIARAVQGERINAAVGVPSRHQAWRNHRPNLPGTRRSEVFWGKGLIDETKLREMYELWGTPSEFIDAAVSSARQPLPVFEIRSAIEAGARDFDWAPPKLRERGFQPEEVDTLMEGIRLRVTKPFKSQLTNEFRALGFSGLIEDEELAKRVLDLGYPQESAALLLATVQVRRAREHAEDMATAFRIRAEALAIDVDDYELALDSLGFTPPEVRLRVAALKAKRDARVARAERAEIKSVMRKTQATQVKVQVQLFRKGFMTALDLENTLVALGLTEELAQAVTVLEEAKLQPKPPRPKVFDPFKLREEIQRTKERALLASFRTGKIQVPFLAAGLLALGKDPELVLAQVAEEAAKLKVPLSPLTLKVESRTERQVRIIETSALLIRFQKGLLSSEALRQELEAIGTPTPIAQALVEREEAKLSPSARAAVAGKLSPAQVQVQRVSRDAAIDLFRKDRIGEAELRRRLLELGIDQELVDALVTRELVRELPELAEARA